MMPKPYKVVWIVCAEALFIATVAFAGPKCQENTGNNRLLPDSTTWKYLPQASVHGLMPYIADFLNSTGEPSLLASAEDATALSYRFGWMSGQGAGFLVIRLSIESDRTGTVVTVRAPFATMTVPSPKPSKTRLNVSSGDAAKFLQLVDEAGFWQMSTVEPQSPIPTGTYRLGASFWVFEGVRSGAYHVVYRQAPDAGPFTEMVHSLAKDLAKLDEAQIPRGVPVSPPRAKPSKHP